MTPPKASRWRGSLGLLAGPPVGRVGPEPREALEAVLGPLSQ